MESSEYIRTPRLIWRRLLMQVIRRALAWAPPIAANSKAAKRPIMAMTTSNSTKVNPGTLCRMAWFEILFCVPANVMDFWSRGEHGMECRAQLPRLLNIGCPQPPLKEGEPRLHEAKEKRF